MNAQSINLETNPASITITAVDFDALDILTRKMDAEKADEAAWEVWETRAMTLYNAVEALPVTVGNAALKARAVRSLDLYGDGELRGDTSTYGRLAHQVVQALGAPPAENSEWSRLTADYRTALAAEQAYDAEHVTPFMFEEDLPDGRRVLAWNIDDADWDESQRLNNLRCAIEDPLMAHPAPDANAFALKVLIARGDGQQADGWDDLLEAEAKRFAYVPSIPSATFEASVARYYHAWAALGDACSRASAIEEVLFERQPPPPCWRRSRNFTLDGVEHTIESVLFESDIGWVQEENPDIADELRALVAGHKTAMAALGREIGWDRAEEDQDAASAALDVAFEAVMSFPAADLMQIGRKIEIVIHMHGEPDRANIARILADIHRLTGAA